MAEFDDVFAPDLTKFSKTQLEAWQLRKALLIIAMRSFALVFMVGFVGGRLQAGSSSSIIMSMLNTVFVDSGIFKGMIMLSLIVTIAMGIIGNVVIIFAGIKPWFWGYAHKPNAVRIVLFPAAIFAGTVEMIFFLLRFL